MGGDASVIATHGSDLPSALQNCPETINQHVIVSKLLRVPVTPKPRPVVADDDETRPTVGTTLDL